MSGLSPALHPTSCLPMMIRRLDALDTIQAADLDGWFSPVALYKSPKQGMKRKNENKKTLYLLKILHYLASIDRVCVYMAEISVYV